LVRLTFWYKNYDGKNSPPVFNVTVGPGSAGQVDLRPIGDTMYTLEAITTVKDPAMPICFQRIGAAPPIVNAIEIRPLPAMSYSYEQLKLDVLVVWWRFACGENPTEKSFRYPSDPLDRVWDIDGSTLKDHWDLQPANLTQVVTTSAAVTLPPPPTNASASTPAPPRLTSFPNAVPQRVLQSARSVLTPPALANRGLEYTFDNLALGRYYVFLYFSSLAPPPASASASSASGFSDLPASVHSLALAQLDSAPSGTSGGVTVAGNGPGRGSPPPFAPGGGAGVGNGGSNGSSGNSSGSNGSSGTTGSTGSTGSSGSSGSTGSTGNSSSSSSNSTSGNSSVSASSSSSSDFLGDSVVTVLLNDQALERQLMVIPLSPSTQWGGPRAGYAAIPFTVTPEIQLSVRLRVKTTAKSRVRPVTLSGLEIVQLFEEAPAVAGGDVAALACVKTQLGEPAVTEEWLGDPCYPVTWPGVQCSFKANSTAVIGLDLGHAGLSGSIPACISNISSLSSLSLNDNSISGNIPPWLGSLKQLHSLKLQDNQLSGSVPGELAQLPEFLHLDLSSNNLSGPFPFPPTASTDINIDGNSYLCHPESAFNLPACSDLGLPVTSLSSSSPPSAPSSSSPPADSSPAMSAVALVFLVLGIILGICIVAAATFVLWRWQKLQRARRAADVYSSGVGMNGDEKGGKGEEKGGQGGWDGEGKGGGYEGKGPEEAFLEPVQVVVHVTEEKRGDGGGGAVAAAAATVEGAGGGVGARGGEGDGAVKVPAAVSAADSTTPLLGGRAREDSSLLLGSGMGASAAATTNSSASTFGPVAAGDSGALGGGGGDGGAAAAAAAALAGIAGAASAGGSGAAQNGTADGFSAQVQSSSATAEAPAAAAAATAATSTPAAATAATSTPAVAAAAAAAAAAAGPPGVDSMILFVSPGSHVRRFSLSDLATATANFHPSHIIGSGGFGPVFKGILPDGRMVAAKKRDEDSLQGEKEFYNEVDLLSRARHPNLVDLIGFCREAGQQVLVYQFMPHGTVRDHLYDSIGNPLGHLRWLQRLHIALGAARGIEYLHKGMTPPIIHRDIKTSNILLDANLNAHVADFGLSREGSISRTHVSTNVKGTAGYLDPEYYTVQQLTDRSDVFSFGVVLLEMISGRQPIDLNRPRDDWSIIDWVRSRLQQGHIEAIIDPTLSPTEFDIEVMWRVAEVGVVCVEPKSFNRPSISDVCFELTHAIQLEAAAGHPPPGLAHSNITFASSGEGSSSSGLGGSNGVMIVGDGSSSGTGSVGVGVGMGREMGVGSSGIGGGNGSSNAALPVSYQPGGVEGGAMLPAATGLSASRNGELNGAPAFAPPNPLPPVFSSAAPAGSRSYTRFRSAFNGSSITSSSLV
ncbi:hypothetical protein CLOP_g11839, partial [Closterium sp. NIES-67]